MICYITDQIKQLLVRALGPKMWNGLPNEMKSAQGVNVFERLIKQWDGTHTHTHSFHSFRYANMTGALGEGLGTLFIEKGAQRMGAILS